jgi:hypothetical protein
VTKTGFDPFFLAEVKPVLGNLHGFQLCELDEKCPLDKINNSRDNSYTVTTKHVGSREER